MYQALALKYRPSTLDEIVGQDVAVTVIKNSIKQNRLHHAILLHGPMGVGKTSIARIIAKSLNCEQGPTIMPCGKCEHCLNIPKSRSLDVIEIDGASNRRVEDARNIIESIKYPPLSARYKIYIVDEVHMLTNEAFNALLKTIEEPPQYVKFIFATTAPEKIPETVLSRCQILKLNRLPKELITKKLIFISEKEKINVSHEAIEMIAGASQGSLRVAEGYLDRCIAYKENNISEEDVEKALGIASHQLVSSYVDSVLSDNEKGVTKLTKSIITENINIEHLLGLVIDEIINREMPKEIKAYLLHIYYSALSDVKKHIDERITLIYASHKAFAAKYLESIENILSKLSHGTVQDKKQSAPHPPPEKQSVMTKQTEAIPHNNNYGDGVKLVLSEFSGKIVSVRQTHSKEGGNE